jgi:rod shape-determining protein MreD
MGYSQRRRLEEQAARELLLILALLGVALVQTALLPRPLGAAPNLLLLLTICYALVGGVARGARVAFYGGLALDLCASTPLGTHALALLGAALATVLLGWLSRGNWLLPLLGAALGALAYHAVLALITSLLVAPVDPQAYALVAAVPDGLATLVPALPAYMALRWLNGRRRGEVPIDVY